MSTAGVVQTLSAGLAIQLYQLLEQQGIYPRAGQSMELIRPEYLIGIPAAAFVESRIRIIATDFLESHPEIKQNCICNDFTAEDLLSAFLRDTLYDGEDVVTKVERFRGVEVIENANGSIDIFYSFSPKP